MVQVLKPLPLKLNLCFITTFEKEIILSVKNYGHILRIESELEIIYKSSPKRTQIERIHKVHNSVQFLARNRVKQRPVLLSLEIDVQTHL